MKLSRRSFINGMCVALATGALSAVSSAEAAEGMASSSVSEFIDADIAVVGAGCSGLAACVQAAELGAKVVCLESTSVTGGMAGGVEGIFAVDSSLQKEQGIEVSVGELVRIEMEQNQYRNSTLGLRDLVKASGDDIDWLVQQGCRFGTVDNYVGFQSLLHDVWALRLPFPEAPPVGPST